MIDAETHKQVERIQPNPEWELFYEVEFTWHDDPAVVEFTVYQLAGFDEDATYIDGENRRTQDRDKAEAVFTGGVRFDGCSNWELGDQHFCSKQEAEGIAGIMGFCYRTAAEIMPLHSDDILGIY